MHHFDEDIEEIVVVLAVDTRVAPANIQRIVQPVLVVGVQQDRQGGGWADTGSGGVQRQLADRNAHAAGARIVQSENAFTVADHDHAHLIETRMRQHGADALAVWVADEQTARVMPVMAELLAALSHRRRVDQRQHLLEIAFDQGVEQRLVGVLQAAQLQITCAATVSDRV